MSISRHGLIPSCIGCSLPPSILLPPSRSYSNLNFEKYGRRSFKNTGQEPSHPNTPQPKSRRILSTAIKNTEQHLQSMFTPTPKTRVVKRARLPKNDPNSANYVQNAWKYHLSASSSQCQADVQRRARLIPQSFFMDNFVLNNIISRMFKGSIGNTALNHACSDCHSSNATFFDSFIPPKSTPRRGVTPFIPSPNSQIIRKSTRIQQLRRRSLSQLCTQQTDRGSDIPRASERFDFSLKRRNSSKLTSLRRIRMVAHRPFGRKLRKLYGPPIVPASSVPITNLLRDDQASAVADLNSGTVQSLRDTIHDLDLSTLYDRPRLYSEITRSKSVDSAGHKVISQDSSEQPSLPNLVPLSQILNSSVWGTDTTVDKFSNIGNAGSVSTSSDLPVTEVLPNNTAHASSTPSQQTSGLLRPLPFGESVLTDVVALNDQPPIARLAHGLDRALFNQSVHWLQDPHSKVFNFSPDLQTLPPVTDFAFERLPKYTSGGEDDRLLDLAVQHSKPFVGSTSTLTKILSHIYFLISENKLVDTSTLSMAYMDQSRRFTPGMRMPAFFTLHPRSTPSGSTHKQVYAVDASRSEVGERSAEWNLLLWLGTMMEKLLTYPKEQFDSLRREHPPTFCFKDKSETYRYAKSSKFIMRSQLDCQDSRLPGTGVFDLKSRAVLPIRIDQLNIEKHKGYLIRQTTGLFESFEREYYDLIRSAFLKYNFQARIGNMDGIFVSYHNTAKLFGFQYIPVTEMEDRLYGTGHPDRGHRIFEKCVGMMESIMERITQCFPGHSLSCTVETRENTNELVIWVVPINYHAYPAPIEEFTVTVHHMVNALPVDGKVAIERAHQNWTIQYFISRSLKSQEHIWTSLQKCQRRADFAMVLPEGVSEHQARAQLNSVNWKTGSGFSWERENENRVSFTVRNAKDTIIASQGTVVHDGLTGPKLTATAHGLIRKLRRMARRRGTVIEVKEPQVMWGRDHDVVSGGPSAQLGSTGSSETILDANKKAPTVLDVDQNAQLGADGRDTADLDK